MIFSGLAMSTGRTFEVFMENVADSSQSRIKMVNDTVECDASAYSEARSSAACGSQ